MINLKQNFFKGIAYTALAKYSGILISIIIGAVLARLLSPAEFGVVALVTVFISFFNILSDMGIGPAIVQNKELTEKDVQSIFLFSISLGVVLSLLFFLSSTIIAYFYNNTELIPLTRLLSLTVLFSAFKIVPNALLLKKLKFKKVGLATVFVQLFSGIFAVILAYKGFSYYALVYKSIFDGFFTFLIFYWLSPIKLKFDLQKSSINKIMRFSTFQFFFNFINYFSRNLDNLLIGKFISPTALGFYDKSYQLMLMPVQNLTHVITPVLHPVLSEFQNDKVLIYKAYRKMLILLANIGFPLSMFLHFSGSDIIKILYGPQWSQSIQAFKILAFSIGIQLVLSTTGAIFQSLNRTDLLFYSGLISAFVMVVGISCGIFIGGSIVSVAYFLLLSFVINFFQAFYVLIKLALKIEYKYFLSIFVYPLFSSFSIAIVLWIFSFSNLENMYFRFFIRLILFLIIFVFVLMIPSKNRELVKSYLRQKKSL